MSLLQQLLNTFHKSKYDEINLKKYQVLKNAFRALPSISEEDFPQKQTAKSC